MMNAEEIADRLGGAKKSGRGWMVRCPCHEDRTASLSIGDGDNGSPVVKCFAGCGQADVIGELKKRGLWPSKSNGFDGHQRKKQIAAYPYTNEEGQLLYEVIRYQPKAFSQRRPNGNGWVWSVQGIRRVPYRLPELVEAISEERLIFVVEGEKDCDNLADLGIPASTNAGGAGKWSDELAVWFAGADVVVIPDREEPGRRHAEQVAGSLNGVARRVRVLELPVKDVSDWIEAGGTSEELYKLAEAAPVWKPGTDQVNEKPKSNSTTFWHGETVAANNQWLVKGLLPLIGIALLSAQWGMLKTFTLLDLAASLITGNTFAHHRVMQQGGVLILAAEGASTLSKRLRGLTAAGKLPEEPQPLAWVSTFPSLLATGAYAELEKMIVEIERGMREKWQVPLVAIAIDTLVAAANFKDESDAAQGQAAMNILSLLAKRFKCCVLAIDHFGKTVETGTRGTSAKEGAADAVLALLGERTISGKVSNSRLAIRKMRDGESGKEISFTPREIKLGVDRDGDEITTLTIDWQTGPGEQKPKSKRRWSKALQTLRRSLETALAEHGQVTRPFGSEGPQVRATDRESLRSEFYKSANIDSETEEKKAEAKKKAFNRALNSALADELIGIRELGGVTLIWLVAPEDESSVVNTTDAEPDWSELNGTGVKADPTPGAGTYST
jgi:hypothetical protein